MSGHIISAGLAATLSMCAMASQAQPLGPVSERSLNATIDACGQNLLFDPDIVAPIILLEPVGWRSMTADDNDWFIDVETHSNMAWFAFSEEADNGPLNAEIVAQLLDLAGRLAAADFQAQLDAGIIFRGEGDALLRLLPDRRECIILTGQSSAAKDVYDALPDPILSTQNSSYLNARMNENAITDGGIFEGNTILTETLSQVFQTDVTLTHVFLTTAKPLDQ